MTGVQTCALPIYIQGGDGDPGMRFTTAIGFSGRGANSRLGSGGQSVIASNTSIAGLVGEGFGAGGSGAYFNRSSGTPGAQSGGAGLAGVIIIHEFR